MLKFFKRGAHRPQTLPGQLSELARFCHEAYRDAFLGQAPDGSPPLNERATELARRLLKTDRVSFHPAREPGERAPAIDGAFELSGDLLNVQAGPSEAGPYDQSHLHAVQGLLGVLQGARRHSELRRDHATVLEALQRELKPLLLSAEVNAGDNAPALRSLRHARRLLAELTDAARIEHGEITLEKETQDPAAQLKDALEEVRGEIPRGTGAQFRARSRGKGCTANVDGERLRLAFVLLLQEFARNRAEIRVHHGFADEMWGVAIEVAPGKAGAAAPAAHATALERKERLVRAIAAAHGGDLRVDRVEAGAGWRRVLLRLPASQVSDRVPATPERLRDIREKFFKRAGT